MNLGFVSAILPDLSLDQVLDFAASAGYASVEIMCWPPGKADRRYAGVTHIDVTSLDESGAAHIREKVFSYGVEISGLGYYPNPLAADLAEAATYVNHLREVMRAAKMLDVPVVNTFIGRNPAQSVDENWPRFLDIWRPLIRLAGDLGLKVGIENCPMLFTRDEWPGGKNLAVSPAIWRRMFSDIPDANFGLNFDPSHLVWQRMDYLKAIREFGSRFVHVHAKDARVDLHKLDDVGILGYPNLFHTPKLPGLGDVQWGAFFAALSDTGYHGAVAVEVEDRAYEGSLELRKESLRQSQRYLRQFMPAK